MEIVITEIKGSKERQVADLWWDGSFKTHVRKKDSMLSIFHGGHCKRHQTNYSRRLCSTSLLLKCLENHKLYGLSRQEEHTHQISWLRTQLV